MGLGSFPLQCEEDMTVLLAACGTDGRGFESQFGPNLHQCLQTCLQVHGSKRLDCHADLYTVSRCHTRGESEESVVCR